MGQWMNPQSGNVGNGGDIRKHAALMTLALLIQRRNPCSPITYLDTHAFAMEHGLASAQWENESARLAARHPGYQPYIALQHEHTRQGRYLCSPGIAARVIAEMRPVFAESDPQCRRRLQAEMEARYLQAPRVLEDFAHWVEYGNRPAPGILLGLVDPFALSRPVWQMACRVVDRLWASPHDGIVLVFDYSRDLVTNRWPCAPRGWVGPVACLDAPPYFLAAYATSPAAAGTVAVLQSLGWRPSAL